MTLDDGAADRQAHAQSVRLRRHEGIEDRFELVGRDSGAVVLNFDQHVRCAVQTCAHDQPPCAGGPGSVHGAEGIDHQVQHDLLQLDTVASDRADVRRQIEVDRDVVHIRVAVRHPLDHADGLVHINAGHPLRRAVALHHGAQSADDFAGALADLAHVGQRAAHFLDVEIGCVEQTLDEVGVAEDRREWLLQFVGQGCGQLPESRDAGDVLEFGAFLQR